MKAVWKYFYKAIKRNHSFFEKVQFLGKKYHFLPTEQTPLKLDKFNFCLSLFCHILDIFPNKKYPGPETFPLMMSQEGFC